MSRRDAAPGTKVFVGNLSWSTNSASLSDVFSQFGEVVDAVVLEDRETGRSRGFGFVTFSTPEAAELAVQQLNGQEVNGRNVRVNLANEQRQERPQYGGGQGGNGGGYGGGY
ncbi:hypothetical protein BASA50_006009 [Batrachochytrium salamandrivorans]|uniref:RRM domain-containing protein n=1 Tax=Batrachochytrium salamandrivorans TaxID=1357716 RepID=A0ABQ8FE13_9FUNG|nr:hypothetical protein BASA60_009994 [Batrachochytrium salamandrivorans]KAH6567421.1 hypothetical protein BASA62_006114 [Batrachochytrium salamandrivorans]KAH6582515.1 hypothetical protein BASA61_008488 [Batrachochytrium salamandrivorans]KAH6595215.1 hypothetical protein BASA50_006009 [Batrachochytrium salamandrivorans]KAH9266721.1 hypothetical protein BASA83_010399 [Batrachochytrium salamandrivorans]